jgi:hypothetical protein
MTHGPMTDTDTAAPRLRATLSGLRIALRGTGLDDAVLEPMRDKGLAHDHIRLVGTGWLARVPKQSQMDLPAAENLAYQAACFRRAGGHVGGHWGGHVPRLRGVLAPGAALPHGALIVEEIVGRPARLPADLPAVARALASLHALPPPATTAPLLAPADPLAALRDEVTGQGAYLAEARLDPATRARIEDAMAALRALCATPARPAACLISFDAHPGNFLIRADGSAVLVDLEKGRYGAASLDLAHATNYTSTTWDLDSHAVLSVEEIAGFYDAWAAVPGVPADAAWHGPLRRAMWLWGVTWCAKWRVLSAAPKREAAEGEDWSAEASDDALIAHVRERVDHYLSPAIVARCLDEFASLERRF